MMSTTVLRAAADQPDLTTERTEALLRILNAAGVDPLLGQRIVGALDQWDDDREQNEAFEEGRESGLNAWGTDDPSNPYQPGTPQHAGYEKGLQDAMDNW